MMNTTVPRARRSDPAPRLTRLALALIFALGAALVFMGVRGQKEYAASGFNAESGYQAVYALSRDVSSAWKNALRC